MDNVCQLDECNGIDRKWEIDKGVPRAATFTDNVTLKMDNQYPHNIMLADDLFNKHRLIVVSGRLKNFLQSRSLVQVEYLPITILDHKGQIASRDYVIVHPINPVDCLDVEQCVPRWSFIDKTRIKELKHFVID